MQAVSALAPSHGAMAACDGRAVKVHLDPHRTPACGVASRSRSNGWNIIAASIALEDAGLEQADLAAAALLGGGADELRPVPATASRCSASARKAPSAPAAAIRLWPQAWPISGSASYSARMATLWARRPCPMRGRGTRWRDRPRLRSHRDARCPRPSLVQSQAAAAVLLEAQLGVGVDLRRPRRAAPGRGASTSAGMRPCCRGHDGGAR
jgi:hypothetical protein